MYFDGNLSVEFTYDGEKFHKTVCPTFAIEDQELKDCWNYVFYNDNETVKFTLVGEYDENDNLSTVDALFIKALCFWNGCETIIDDIDIV